ncbi:MAG: tetratricopeptide repeat protein [Blastocatellia bacterium]
MKATFFFVVIFLLVGLNFACSSSGAPAGNAVNTSSADALPEYSDANLALADGTNFLDTGETEKAIDALNQAVKLNPDLAEAYFKLGIAYALVETRDAVKIDTEVTPAPEPGVKKPKDKKSNSEIAFEKAIEAYKKIVSANKEDDSAYFQMGLAYNKLNDDEEAAKSLKQAVKLKPDDTEYQTELGAILIKLAQYHEAIAPLKKAIELDPENIEAEELLEEAEAGRRRVDFIPVKKDDKLSNSNSANTNTNTAGAEKPQTKPDSKETKPPPPANKPKQS